MPTSTARKIATKSPRAPARKERALPPMPVEKTNLTPAERALLADPNYVTEDEADFIIGERRRKRGGRMISLEEARKRLGYDDLDR